jgi:hypothetical protein
VDGGEVTVRSVATAEEVKTGVVLFEKTADGEGGVATGR